jgi:hypothetical protein
MRQKYTDEDRLELEAHFAERVQAYIELGETPEQALISARAKFGEHMPVLRELHRRRLLRHPLLVASSAAAGWLGLWALLGVPMLAILTRWQHDSQLVGEPGPLLSFLLVVAVILGMMPTALASIAVWRWRLAVPRAALLGMLLASLALLPLFGGVYALGGLLGVAYLPVVIATERRARGAQRRAS